MDNIGTITGTISAEDLKQMLSQKYKDWAVELFPDEQLWTDEELTKPDPRHRDILQATRMALEASNLLCRTCHNQITGYAGIIKCKCCHKANGKKNYDAMRARVKAHRAKVSKQGVCRWCKQPLDALNQIECNNCFGKIGTIS